MGYESPKPDPRAALAVALGLLAAEGKTAPTTADVSSELNRGHVPEQTESSLAPLFEDPLDPRLKEEWLQKEKRKQAARPKVAIPQLEKQKQTEQEWAERRKILSEKEQKLRDDIKLFDDILESNRQLIKNMNPNLPEDKVKEIVRKRSEQTLFLKGRAELDLIQIMQELGEDAVDCSKEMLDSHGGA